jgi:hypothetical protein
MGGHYGTIHVQAHDGDAVGSAVDNLASVEISRAKGRRTRHVKRSSLGGARPLMKLLVPFVLALLATVALPSEPGSDVGQKSLSGGIVDPRSLRGKVLCGYQGWFRCPGDSAKQGWIHWSHESKRLAPETLAFEMWPDMTDYAAEERFAAPGFSSPDGTQSYLFSSDQPGTVRRHFAWMRAYGIDGVWLQHFLVDLPGGPLRDRYASRTRVLENVRAAAQETGRTWAIAFDVAGMPAEKIFETLTREWRKLVDEGTTQDQQYLHEKGLPVVQIWGFYYGDPHNAMTARVANQLIDFFKAPGPSYRAFVVGGGDWGWRHNPDPEWQAFLRRFDAYSPWNVGNVSKDSQGVLHASTGYWDEDKRECEKNGMLWLPVIYPGFSWDNLQKLSPGRSLVPRRRGQFLWEQFHTLSGLGVNSVCVAMFDEVDEGTAIFKVTNRPPNQGHFLTYEGMPGDWYLRLVGEATRMLREKSPIPAEIPIKP